MGAGFAGLAAVRTLAKAGALVTLIDHTRTRPFNPCSTRWLRPG
ncbi:FAD-dependent oxidoreductase [Nonomuraea sp. NPDC049625]